MAAVRGTVGFLGFGNMGSVIAEGLLRMGVVSAQHLLVYDPDPARQEQARQLGAEVADSPAELAKRSNLLMLAVKPQTMGEALAELKPHLEESALVISIAAGLPISFFQQELGASRRIVRVMPNTPALVSAGASAIALSDTCTEADAAAATAIFESVGLAVFVDDDDMHAVTALSGSGPAYFFRMVEAMEEAAIAEGLAPELARQLAVQTLYGAGMLLWSTKENPAELRRRVTSKGGTTEAALNAFAEAGFEEVVTAGLKAAAARSREMASGG